MKTRVVLTVDTEPSVAGAYDDPRANPPLIDEPVWGEVAGRSEALGFLLRTLSAHALTATFFVETAHAACFTDRPMGRCVEALTEAGQDVQLHLHPNWHNFRDGRLADDGAQVSDHCHEIGAALLDRLIGEGAERIERWTGRRPAGFRAGNFSADRATFAALRRAGLRCASNVCAALPATADAALNRPGGAHTIDGIVELPVTCFADPGPAGRGRLRPLQVTACSFAEMRALLTRLHADGGGVAVIVTHPFEYLLYDDRRFANMRANRMVQRRLERLCAFLAGNADRFAVVPLEDAAGALAGGCDAPALRGSPVASILRTAENVINDRFR